MNRVAVIVVHAAPAADADLAFKEWARRHPQLRAQLNEEDIEVTIVCDRETLVAKRRYAIMVSEEVAATLATPDEQSDADRAGG